MAEQPLSLDLDARQVNALLERTLRVRDTKPLMERIGRVVVTDTQMNFRQGQSPDGKRWAPLQIRQGQPLRDTGRLMRSITYDASESEVSIGTNVKYAPTHQFGAEITPKRGQFLAFTGKDGTKYFATRVVVPARPFIGLGHRQVDKINREMDRWFQEILND